MWNIFFYILIGVGVLLLLLILIVLLIIGLAGIFCKSENPNNFEIVGQSGGGRCYYYQPTEEEKLRIQMERQEEQDVTELASSEKELEYLKIKKELKDLKKEIKRINDLRRPQPIPDSALKVMPKNIQESLIASDKRHELAYWAEKQKLKFIKKKQKKLFLKKIKYKIVILMEKIRNNFV